MFLLEDFRRRYVGKKVKAGNITGLFRDIMYSGGFVAIIECDDGVKQLPFGIVELIDNSLPLPG